MKIAIIGAGFTGLSAAYTLAKKGFEVNVFEGEGKPGGLALGFKENSWDWSFEAHYHHLFTSDHAIRDLAKEIGHEITFIRPKTSTLIGDDISQLDSPLSLLAFNKLSLQDRIKTGAVIAYMKLTPFWHNLEKVTAKEFLLHYMGENSWKVLWQPLFLKKFGKYYSSIPASWFWARIKKRSTALGYPVGGFQELANHLQAEIEKLGGTFNFKTPVKKLEVKEKVLIYTFTKVQEFDAVIVTLPTPLFTYITNGLPQNYLEEIASLKGIGAVNLVLSLNKQFLKDGTYWLNINNLDYPFLAIVEHTNFMNKSHYNDEHLMYVGNYIEKNHRYFNYSASQLLKEYMPFLQKVNPEFDRAWINRADAFKVPFAQPIIPLNYSQHVPSMKTPLKMYICPIFSKYIHGTEELIML